MSVATAERTANLYPVQVASSGILARPGSAEDGGFKTRVERALTATAMKERLAAPARDLIRPRAVHPPSLVQTDMRAFTAAPNTPAIVPITPTSGDIG